jgi:hypothetical protein
MKRPILFAFAAILLATGSTLAFMNNVCKTGHHAWCTPVSITQHDMKMGPG